ncbi:MAG TPA: succinyl-diaminopimelate desuccinylase [Chloroflexota bacterium]|nr:succinyl-diaminopimelate desuccinylase [Chloroflexota bacterium]
MTTQAALARRTLELVNIPSVSRQEQRLHEHVAAIGERLRSLRLTDEPGQGLLIEPAQPSGRPWVLLAGHLDTVPEQANLPGRIDGDTLHGLGASDMKSSLAIMIELAEWLDRERPTTALDFGFLFFAREELPISESAVPHLFRRCPQLRQAALVLVMEPTDTTLQVGCLGNLNAELAFQGKSAHSARPWQGDNALHKAIAGLQALAAQPPKPVTIGELTYTEVLSLTQIQGGIAQNVIPDRVTCHLNFRYAPNRTPAEAEAQLRALVPTTGRLRVIGNAPPARAAVNNPLIDTLRRLGDLPLEAKQAWTPVAEFSAEGLDAVNFGPGSSRFAHQQDEQVHLPDVTRAFDLLRRFALEGA